MKNLDIIYENSEILIIDKPAGFAVQGGVGIAHSLDDELSRQLGYKIYLVHRLDKETFGLMIVAKSPKAASKWISLISGKLVKKEYKAVCFGSPIVNGRLSKKGKISSPVTKGERELPAETNFEVLKTVEVCVPELEPLKLSLVHLVLGTGRMHQIRIHLAKSAAPIAGDDKHGNFKMNKIARKVGIKNLLLCSCRLSIPIDGKTVTFEKKLPDFMIHFFEDNDTQ